MNSEILAEFFSLAFYVLAAGLLTVGGLLAEYTSLQHYGAGEVTIALWLAALGAIMLYAGAYGVGYGKVLSRLV